MSLPGTMIAWRLVRYGRKAELQEVPLRRPAAGEVLVRVAGNGLCHSDLVFMDPETPAPPFPDWQFPFTLGHEVAGWVEETGSGVAGFSPGQAVILAATSPDGACDFCQAGHDNNCENAYASRGLGRDGGLAPYVLVRNVRPLIPLATLDPHTAGPLADAGATSFHAVRRILPRLTPPATAVVIGVGGLGSFAVQFLRILSGARVIALDVNPVRLEYARALGAHECVPGVTNGSGEDLRSLTGPRGAEVVLDFVGTDATIAAGLAVARRAGSFGLVGAGMGTLEGAWFHHLPKDGEVFTFTAARWPTCARWWRSPSAGSSATTPSASPSTRCRSPTTDSHAGSSSAARW